jgi:hypothetical protein
LVSFFSFYGFFFLFLGGKQMDNFFCFFLFPKKYMNIFLETNILKFIWIDDFFSKKMNIFGLVTIFLNCEHVSLIHENFVNCEIEI